MEYDQGQGSSTGITRPGGEFGTPQLHGSRCPDAANVVESQVKEDWKKMICFIYIGMRFLG